MHSLTSNRRLTSIVVVVLALVVCALAVFVAPNQAYASRPYGQLSSKYESNNDPSAIVDGVAYGAYQMTPANAYKFSVWLSSSTNTKYAGWGKQLVQAYKKDSNACGTNFGKAWRAIGAASPGYFFSRQYSYCKINFYNPAVRYCKQAVPGFYTKNYSYGLRNVLFSTAIQHGTYGTAYYIFKPAVESLGGWKNGLSEEKLIDAIYYERSRVVSKAPVKTGAVQISKTNETAKKYDINGKYLAHFYSCSSAVQIAVYIRLHETERLDAQALRKQYIAANSCKHAKKTGGVIKCSKISDTTHVESATAVVCSKCGQTLKAAYTKTVTNTYVAKGAKYIEKRTKRAYVVHSLWRYYKVALETVNLRAGTSKNSVLITTLPKDTIIKPLQVVVNKSGFYWANVEVGEYTGWLRMGFLTPIGTAGVHKFSKGKCIYCGFAKNRLLTSPKVGTYKFRARSAGYAGARKTAKKLKSFKKGNTAKVVKIVIDVNNDYWAKLKSGCYVKLTRLRKVK